MGKLGNSKWLLAVALATGITSFAIAESQDQAPAPPRTKLLLTIERWKKDGWETANAQSVFKPQDRLRFRFRTSVSGYLYILNQASSGKTSWIYPLKSTHPDELSEGQEVIIPNTEGSFAVGGPPGFDTLYWIMRSTPFELHEVPADKLDVPSTLISRCPEETSETEVTCLDKNAGPKALTDTKKLQSAIGLPGSLVARDLTFEPTPKATEISTNSDGASDGIMYQLKIAHN
jgi:hypothetical protein